MKKIIKVALALLIASSVLFLTGCEKEKEDNTTQITYTHGKGIIKLNVPKDDEGNAKYVFTTTKPEGLSTTGTFYLVTDSALFGFSTSGLSYNTGTEYKAKYGETKATFDGYLAFIDDESLSTRPKLAGMERFELNGRKALRYYNRAGGSGKYEYYGYFYMVAVDEIYPGSKLNMTVNYKVDERPTETKEFDEETLAIIKSLKVEPIEQ